MRKGLGVFLIIFGFFGSILIIKLHHHVQSSPVALLAIGCSMVIAGIAMFFEKQIKENIYVGFKSRALALLIDAVIYGPIYFGLIHLGVKFSKPIYLAIFCFASLFSVLLNICFHYKYAATPGKYLMKIKVSKTDGSKIGLKNAFFRSSVDLIFALGLLASSLFVYSKIDYSAYHVLSYTARLRMTAAVKPIWVSYLVALQQIWTWGELIVVLLNEKRRAPHDFIAGTVLLKRGIEVVEKS